MTRLSTCKPLRDVIAQEVLERIDEECDSMLPHFRVLNSGRSSDATTTKAIAYYQAPSSETDQTSVETTAKMVHAWLCLPRSPLRSAVAIFSSSGIFYVAQCHEKGARAFTQHGGGDVGAFAAGAVAKSSMSTPHTGGHDLSGLTASSSRVKVPKK